MVQDQIKDQLLDFITRSFMVDLEEIILEESLIDQGIIDSFGLVEIATFMEHNYGFSVSEEEMTRANFGSALKIVAYVKRRLEQ